MTVTELIPGRERACSRPGTGPATASCRQPKLPPPRSNRPARRCRVGGSWHGAITGVGWARPRLGGLAFGASTFNLPKERGRAAGPAQWRASAARVPIIVDSARVRRPPSPFGSLDGFCHRARGPRARPPAAAAAAPGTRTAAKTQGPPAARAGCGLRRRSGAAPVALDQHGKAALPVHRTSPGRPGPIDSDDLHRPNGFRAAGAYSGGAELRSTGLLPVRPAIRVTIRHRPLRAFQRAPRLGMVRADTVAQVRVTARRSPVGASATTEGGRRRPEREVLMRSRGGAGISLARPVNRLRLDPPRAHPRRPATTPHTGDFDLAPMPSDGIWSIPPLPPPPDVRLAMRLSRPWHGIAIAGEERHWKVEGYACERERGSGCVTGSSTGRVIHRRARSWRVLARGRVTARVADAPVCAGRSAS